jgi:hypothetical protein
MNKIEEFISKWYNLLWIYLSALIVGVYVLGCSYGWNAITIGWDKLGKLFPWATIAIPICFLLMIISGYFVILQKLTDKR